MSIIFYILSVVACNVMFAAVEPWRLLGEIVPPGSLLAGAVFVARDYAHRAHPRTVLPAMTVAAVLSYLLASPAVAVASAGAFAVSELVDYVVFRGAAGSFRRRVLLSSAIAAPLDTALFLGGIGALSCGSLLVMSAVKMLAAFVVAARSRA